MIDKKVSVFGYGRNTQKIIFRPFSYSFSGREDSISIDSFAEETINRDYGFADMAKKLDIYGTRSKKQYEVEKEIIEAKINTQIQAIFKTEYIRMLNRGFSQKDAKNHAWQEAKKYRDEELSYWNKKLLL